MRYLDQPPLFDSSDSNETNADKRKDLENKNLKI